MARVPTPAPDPNAVTNFPDDDLVRFSKTVFKYECGDRRNAREKEVFHGSGPYECGSGIMKMTGDEPKAVSIHKRSFLGKNQEL